MNFKELFIAAKEQLGNISSLEKSDFRLEQAEYDEKTKVWEIIVSYLVENTNKPINSFSLGQEYPFHRIYKKVKINNKKEVVGFYIYDNKK